MNIAAKITSLTGANKVSIGQYVYEMLHPSIKARFNEATFNSDEWRYTDRHMARLTRSIR